MFQYRETRQVAKPKLCEKISILKIECKTNIIRAKTTNEIKVMIVEKTLFSAKNLLESGLERLEKRDGEV